jgi:hypothetical protein
MNQLRNLRDMLASIGGAAFLTVVALMAALPIEAGAMLA